MTVLLIIAVSLTSICVKQETTKEKNVKSITLNARTKPQYDKSGYSFRYKAQDKAKHKNYVDVVYQNGRLVINHHGGLQARIGKVVLESLNQKHTSKAVQRWENRSVEPVAGDYYVLETAADNHTLTSLFRVTDVKAKSLTFEWIPPKKNWPVSLQYRGSAGESGFSVRPRRSYEDQ